jgi:hypothetical protein
MMASNGVKDYRPVRLAYQPPASSTFSLRTNQPSATNQQYFSLRTNQHQPPATSQTNRLYINIIVNQSNQSRQPASLYEHQGSQRL